MDIVKREALTVVGIPVVATWEELGIEVPKAWKELFARHTEIDDRLGETYVDVGLDEIDNEYSQLICMPVSRLSKIPNGMRAIEIPAQQYIHHKHVGPVTGIYESFVEIYDWAQENGYPSSEFKLDFGYTVDGDELGHDLYVGLLPVKQWRYVAGS